MPVRNGQRYLAPAIRSLLEQSFADFELIISDNASDDDTQEICRDLARSDRRIIYRRQEGDIGANSNFNLVLSLARGSLFAWAAHDDLRDGNFLSVCVAALRDDPEAVSCGTGIELIDEQGKRIRLVTDSEGLTSTRWRTRVASIVARRDRHIGFGFYGLHRIEALQRAGPLAGQFGADVILTLRLAKVGRWQWVSDPLIGYRIREKEGELTWRRDTWVGDRPISRLIGTVWRELGDAPDGGEAVLARMRFLVALGRPGPGWHRLLLKENGSLLRSAMAERNVASILKHAVARLTLDPAAPFRTRNWIAARGAWRALREGV